MPKKRLLLIDGSSLLSVNFYGNLPTAYLRAKTEEEREKCCLNCCRLLLADILMVFWGCRG